MGDTASVHLPVEENSEADIHNGNAARATNKPKWKNLDRTGESCPSGTGLLLFFYHKHKTYTTRKTKMLNRYAEESLSPLTNSLIHRPIPK